MRHAWRLSRRACRALRRSKREICDVVREYAVTVSIIGAVMIVIGLYDIVNMIVKL